MRIAASATSVSWIPSESVSGLLRGGFEVGLAHYDRPPPSHVEGRDGLEALRSSDRFRFANFLSAWIEVEDGLVTDAGWSGESDLLMGSTTVRLAGLGATFRGYSLPVRRGEPEISSDRAAFSQTAGGRTGVPLPRPVPHAPFLQWQAPLVWTTLTLVVRVDGQHEVSLPGASAFPRHWVYDTDGSLTSKSGLTDQDRWIAHSFGVRTPWGASDSPALVVTAESELERQMAGELMRAGRRPAVRRLPAGTTVTTQGDPGEELLLLLDGILRVEVDGRVVAEVGPGAVVGERALLEGGRRTSTLVAVTAVRLAAASADAVDTNRLRALADLHRREDGPAPTRGA